MTTTMTTPNVALITGITGIAPITGIAGQNGSCACYHPFIT